MSDKAVCCRCGFSEYYLVEEEIDPVEGTKDVVVLPKNWNKLTFGPCFNYKLLCPKCSNKLESFLDLKPKNLAHELLLLANCKKEFEDSEIKNQFNETCKRLKVLAKNGKTRTNISIPGNMIDLFRQHGFIVHIRSTFPGVTNDIFWCEISWEWS